MFRISFSFLSSLTNLTCSSIPCYFCYIICSCWRTTELLSFNLCLFCFPSLRVFSIMEFPLLISSILCFNFVSIFSTWDFKISFVSDIYLFWSCKDCWSDWDFATKDSLSFTSRCKDYISIICSVRDFSCVNLVWSKDLFPSRNSLSSFWLKFNSKSKRSLLIVFSLILVSKSLFSLSNS